MTMQRYTIAYTIKKQMFTVTLDVSKVAERLASAGANKANLRKLAELDGCDVGEFRVIGVDDEHIKNVLVFRSE